MAISGFRVEAFPGLMGLMGALAIFKWVRPDATGLCPWICIRCHLWLNPEESRQDDGLVGPNKFKTSI